MKYLNIPKTDLQVSGVCYGQMKLGIGNFPEENVDSQLNLFLDLGGNFIDTARTYSDWVPGEIHRSERILGDYFRRNKNRDKLVIVSKGCHYDLATKVQRVSAAELIEDIDGSLKSLGTDYIDMYLFHRDNAEVPVEELMDAACQAVKAGKIRYFGFSNWTVERMKAADAYAQAKYGMPATGNQMTLNPTVMFNQTMRDTTMTIWNKNFADYHRESQMLVMACSSLAYGLFLRYKDPQAAKFFKGSPYDCEAFYKTVAEFEAICKETGMTMTQLCLRYTADYPGFAAIPVFSASTPEHLREAMNVFDVYKGELPFARF